MQYNNPFECIVTPDGVRRSLAMIPPDPNKPKLFASWASANPILPESDWIVHDHTDFGEGILDQGQTNSCVAHASTGAIEETFARQSGRHIQLAPFGLYVYINGGRDQGANIGDSLDWATKVGVPELQYVPFGTLRQSSLSQTAIANALLYRVEGYHLSTWEEGCSASTFGFSLVYGIKVGWNFQSLSSENVPGYAPGMANHAIRASGLVRLKSGEIGLDGKNSWSLRWGSKGCMVTTRRHFECSGQDAYAIRAVRVDPLTDPNLPPVMR